MSDEMGAVGPAERRERLIALAAERRRTGALSLEEHVSLVHRARAASTAADLTALEAQVPPPGAVGAPERRWILAALGGAEQRGRWLAPRSLRVVSVLGGAELDLGRACVVGDEVSITCVALLGGLTVLAPPGIPVELSGASLLGGRSDERRRAEAVPGAPVVRLRVVAVLGGASVEEPGVAGVGLEAAESGLILRLGRLRGLRLRARRIVVPYEAIRAVRRGAAGDAPGTPFTALQGDRLALFRDPDRALTLEVAGVRAGGRELSEIAVEVDDPELWLARLTELLPGAAVAAPAGATENP